MGGVNETVAQNPAAERNSAAVNESVAQEQVKVGIRYCGGCNSRYDRGAMVKRIIKKHPEWDAGVAREGIDYDLLLVIGGCSACCAAYEQFSARQVRKLWTDVDDIPAD